MLTLEGQIQGHYWNSRRKSYRPWRVTIFVCVVNSKIRGGGSILFNDPVYWHRVRIVTV